MGPRVGFAASASVGVGRRDEVDAARGKRMASTHAPDGEIRAARGAMILDCLARVIRTGRIKTATVAEHRAHGNLVEAQQGDQYRFHTLGGAVRRRVKTSRAGANAAPRMDASLGRGLRRPAGDLPNRSIEQLTDFGRAHRRERGGSRARQRFLVEARVLPQQQVVTGEFGPAQAKRVARQPLHEVTCDCTRRILLADDEPQTSRLTGRLAVDHEVRGAPPGAQTKNG
ncbi:hypothetical protein GEM_0265 [Burkholderia cepacia GG4]|uniref:Uncharacterized protein n=1 Tax=Burkholderia cepacia GG4 TaxID=1009846 RepID=A0A9W3JWN9_BURCE|nr:hypothetical protein GEM_0265 [Burkholderia cepacia GG4]